MGWSPGWWSLRVEFWVICHSWTHHILGDELNTHLQTGVNGSRGWFLSPGPVFHWFDISVEPRLDILEGNWNNTAENRTVSQEHAQVKSV